MERANETAAMFMDGEAAKCDREIFVHNLGVLLSQTREGVVSCTLIDAEKPNEHVAVAYKGDSLRRIGTYSDSYQAIILDVVRRI